MRSLPLTVPEAVTRYLTRLGDLRVADADLAAALKRHEAAVAEEHAARSVLADVVLGDGTHQEVVRSHTCVLTVSRVGDTAIVKVDGAA